MNLRIIFLASAVFFNSFLAEASIGLFEKDQWKVSLAGFIEQDTIYDSTRSLTEAIGNTPIDRPDTLAGQSGRTQFSLRNSRLSFTVDAPEIESWKTKAYLEFDFLGYDPVPGTNNSESSYFSSPTLRIRHAYLNAEKFGFQFLAGQYWGGLGFQPYYFLPNIGVSPLAGTLYTRTTQVRGLKSFNLTNDTILQALLSLQRPPQRDAIYPDLTGGFRMSFGSRTAGYTGSATGAQKTQPMSFAVTGSVREFVIPQNPLSSTSGDNARFIGSGLAVNGLIPVIASSDDKSVGNTLSIGGEFTTGKGYGDQFTSWTGNLASPLNTVTTAPEKNVNLDAGIGGFTPDGLFQLVDIRTFNAYFQYHLPESTKTWISGGYSRLYSDNIDFLTSTGANLGKTSAGKVPYDKEQIYFANIAHDLTKQIRLGFEFSHLRTNYQDGVIAHNNRYQLSAFFIF